MANAFMATIVIGIIKPLLFIQMILVFKFYLAILNAFAATKLNKF